MGEKNNKRGGGKCFCGERVTSLLLDWHTLHWPQELKQETRISRLVLRSYIRLAISDHFPPKNVRLSVFFLKREKMKEKGEGRRELYFGSLGPIADIGYRLPLCLTTR